jgi:hypothetical protein
VDDLGWVEVEMKGGSLSLVCSSTSLKSLMLFSKVGLFHLVVKPVHKFNFIPFIKFLSLIKLPRLKLSGAVENSRVSRNE